MRKCGILGAKIGKVRQTMVSEMVKDPEVICIDIYRIIYEEGFFQFSNEPTVS